MMFFLRKEKDDSHEKFNPPVIELRVGNPQSQDKNVSVRFLRLYAWFWYASTEEKGRRTTN